MTRFAWFIRLIIAYTLVCASATSCARLETEPPDEAVGEVSVPTVSTTNAEFLSWNGSGGLTAVSSQGWSKDWSHVLTLDSGWNVLFYRRHDRYVKLYSYNSSGTITYQQQRYEGQGWTHVEATPWNASYGGANTIWYDRTTGDFKAALYSNTSYSAKFTQSIPHPTWETDAGTGWDIVEPLNYNGIGVVLFYSRITGEIQFWVYDAATNKLNPWFSKFYRQIWDDIESGEFSGTAAYDEIVLHNKDSGETVLFDWAEDESIQTFWSDISHTAILAAGDFGGSSKDDFMLYQAVVKERAGGAGAFITTNGRATRFIDTAAGRVSSSTGTASTWTHIMPTKTNDGVLFYRDPKEVKVFFVFGGITSAQAANEYASDALADWILYLDRTYASAGLDFELAGYLNSSATEVTSYKCGLEPEFEAVNAKIQSWRTLGSIPDDAIVILSTTLGSGACASPRSLFVKTMLPSSAHETETYYNDDTATTTRPGLLSHEVGHFLGIGHTFIESHNALSTVLDFLEGGTAANHMTIFNLDSDGSSGTALDTLPSLKGGVWADLEDLGWSRCDDGTTILLPTDNGAGGTSEVKIRATPHDVMSYIDCDEVRSITYDQVRRVRQTVYDDGAWNPSVSEWTGGRSYLLQ